MTTRDYSKEQHIYPNGYFLLRHTIDGPDGTATTRPPWIFDPLPGDDARAQYEDGSRYDETYQWRSNEWNNEYGATALVSTSHVVDVRRKDRNGAATCAKTTSGFSTGHLCAQRLLKPLSGRIDYRNCTDVRWLALTGERHLWFRQRPNRQSAATSSNGKRANRIFPLSTVIDLKNRLKQK